MGVLVIERWVLARLRDHKFFSLAELNQAMTPIMAELNQREMKHLGQSRLEMFEEIDKPALLPLPKKSWEYAQWKLARVHIDYHISFEQRPWSPISTVCRTP